MDTQQTFMALIELKLSQLNERVIKDAATDWQENYHNRDFRPGELEEFAADYLNLSLMQELYLQTSKKLNK